MRHVILSPAGFTAVDELIAKAGDLKIPAAMKAAELNVTIRSAAGNTLV